MAPHSSTFAWKIPWMEEPGGLRSMGSLESDTTEQLHFHFSLSCIGEGNGNPLQCSWLENPRDSGAWWAAVYGVAQSRTRLKRHSSNIPLCIVPELSYPFICWWTSRLFPCPGYCKQCWDEPWGTCVSFNSSFQNSFNSSFLGVYVFFLFHFCFLLPGKQSNNV